MSSFHASLPARDRDKYGFGDFGAPRGGRTHNGVDIAAPPGSLIYPVCAGTCTKVGYPYSNDLSYRYVEITDIAGLRYRYFYLTPTVEEGETVSVRRAIGVVQSLQTRYPGITDHFHFEIKRANGEFVDPTPLLRG